MKRITSLIFALTAFTCSRAQSLKWGPEYTATLVAPTLGQLIPGSINNKVYILENPVRVETFEKRFMTSLRIFNGATKLVKEVMLSDVLSQKMKVNPDKIYVSDALIWKNEIRVIFTPERNKKAHGIFYVQHFSENGQPISDPIQLPTVEGEKGVYWGRMNDHIRSVAYKEAQDFTYAVSPDSSKFVQMEVFTEIKSVIKSVTKIYLHVLDKNLKLLQTKKLNLEGEGSTSKIMSLKVNDRGDLFILAATEKKSQDFKQDKFQDPYWFQVYVSPVGSDNPFRSKTLTLPENQYPASAEMFMGKDNEVFVTGMYINTADKERGRNFAGYFCGSFSGYTPDIKLKAFPTSNDLFDRIYRVQKMDIPQGGITIGGKIFFPPVPKRVVPELGLGHYVIAEVTVRETPSASFKKNIFSGDLVVYFINNKNEIPWFKHIPKRQEFLMNAISYCNYDNILSFQAIVDSANKLNIVYLDRKENDMPDARVVDKKIEVVRIDFNQNDAGGLTHVQYDISGNRTKRTYFDWSSQQEGSVLSSAAMTLSDEKAVILTYKIYRRKLSGLKNSEYRLAEFDL